MSDELSGETALSDSRWTVLAIALPAFSYLFVYSINVGEATHFGIPAQLVTVAFGDVLRVGFFLGVLGSLFIFSLRGLSLGEPAHPGLRELAAPILVSGLFALLQLWSNGPTPFTWFLLVVLVLNVALAVFRVVRYRRRLGSYSAVFDAYASREPAALSSLMSPKAWAITIERAIAMRPLSLVVVVLVLCFFATLGQGIGRGIASRQDQFMVGSGRVVLMMRDQDAVVSRVTRDGNLAGPIEVVSLTQLGELTLTSVGPFRSPNE